MIHSINLSFIDNNISVNTYFYFKVLVIHLVAFVNKRFYKPSQIKINCLESKLTYKLTLIILS